MAHLAHIGSPRNTNIRGSPSLGKSRNWCFTLNNYEVEEPGTLAQLLSEKNFDFVFQEETGAQGTKHLQGLIICGKNAVSFNTIKSLLPKAHIEKCKNKQASINYCSKEDTRTGNIYTNINIKGVEKKTQEPKRKMEYMGNEDWTELFGMEYTNWQLLGIPLDNRINDKIAKLKGDDLDYIQELNRQDQRRRDEEEYGIS